MLVKLVMTTIDLDALSNVRGGTAMPKQPQPDPSLTKKPDPPLDPSTFKPPVTIGDPSTLKPPAWVGSGTGANG